MRKLFLTAMLGLLCAMGLASSLGCNGAATGGPSPASVAAAPQTSGRTLYATKDTRNLMGPSQGALPSPPPATPPASYDDTPPGRGNGYTLQATKNTANLPDGHQGSGPAAPQYTPPASPGHEYGQNGPALMAQAQARLDQGDAAEALSLYEQAARAGNMDQAAQARAHMGRGEALAAMSRWAEAADAYTAALNLDPGLTRAYLGRAQTYSERSMYVEALEDYSRATQNDPGSAIAHNEMAWILATCPDSNCLNGERAVAAAEQAVALTNGNEISYLDTLAAAYAEAKRFDDAVATQERVVETLRASNSSWLMQAQQRLELYRGFKPFRDR